MDTAGKNEAVSNEAMQLVLLEFNQEQQELKQTVGDLVTAVNIIGNKIEVLKFAPESKQEHTSTDYQPTLDAFNKKVDDIKTLLGERSKPEQRKFQLLLFPEQDRKLFYKIVFGRWLLYLVIMLLLNNLYKWGMHYSDNQKEIRLERLQQDHIKRSWNYLYDHSGREVKRLMNEAAKQSEEQGR